MNFSRVRSNVTQLASSTRHQFSCDLHVLSSSVSLCRFLACEAVRSPWSYIHCDIMPGSSIISGVFPLFDCRRLFPDKPKSVTYDSEIAIGRGSDGEEQVINAVLHHFVPGQEQPDEELLYLVSGKVASITNHSPVGEGRDSFDYDLEIDVLTVRVPSVTLFAELLKT
jgi:hypothetical protein